jgi:type IV secretory pathway VirB4 component
MGLYVKEEAMKNYQAVLTSLQNASKIITAKSHNHCLEAMYFSFIPSTKYIT